MHWQPLAAPAEIRQFALRAPWRFLFHLGDLDEVEWPVTDFYAWRDDADEISELIFIYRGLSLPCAHLFGRHDSLGDKLTSLLPLLPRAGWIHCSAEELPALRARYRLKEHGPFLRLAWMGFPEDAAAPGADGAVRLSAADLPELTELLTAAYPDTHFEPSQLAKGLCYGLRRAGKLLACAGLHVHSPTEGVAMLGNIATHPDHRGQGLARVACAALLTELEREIGRIGLNVSAGNAAALSLYHALGFREVLRYEELYFEEPSP
ncbi:MAG: GNAT family N-acetyltransferase [bacterium]|nr:GNAT family N-acetyltransferase [bacterium]